MTEITADKVNEYMKIAISLGKEAGKKGEIPVGCLLVKGDEIISQGANSCEEKKNSLCHSEMEAINTAIEKTGEKLLPECDIYVTLEPCPMCAGAIKNAGIRRVFFGAYDRENGGCLSKWNILGENTEVYGGIMKEECEDILKEFFKNMRKQ